VERVHTLILLLVLANELDSYREEQGE